jgi:alkyl hydroperoxide reductase subunit D
MCIDSHEQVLKKAGVTAEVIQAGARVAAVMKAVATIHAAAA